MKKRVIIPEELNYISASAGFECATFEDIIAFAKYFHSIGCSFKVIDLCILPEAELIPLKRCSDNRDVYEFLMIEF